MAGRDAGQRRVHHVPLLLLMRDVDRQGARPRHMGDVADLLLAEGQNAITTDHARAQIGSIANAGPGTIDQFHASAPSADRPACAEGFYLVMRPGRVADMPGWRWAPNSYGRITADQFALEQVGADQSPSFPAVSALHRCQPAQIVLDMFELQVPN